MTTLADVVAAVRLGRDEAGAAGPRLVGIAGAVAVGKSTLAAELAEALAPLRTVVVSTDGFLRTNDDLAARGLLMQKGFPPSYDDGLLLRFVEDLRAGRDASVPRYSHATYDREPDGHTTVAGDNDVVIIEGVNALQPPLVDRLDVRLYLAAPESVIRRWYVARFLDQVELARHDEASFYRRFVDLPEEQCRQIAESTWTGINLVNLVEHIEPTRAAADLVLTKAEDHSLV